MTNFDRLVVGVDGSGGSARALAWAATHGLRWHEMPVWSSNSSCSMTSPPPATKGTVDGANIALVALPINSFTIPRSCWFSPMTRPSRNRSQAQSSLASVTRAWTTTQSLTGTQVRDRTTAGSPASLHKQRLAWVQALSWRDRITRLRSLGSWQGRWLSAYHPISIAPWSQYPDAEQPTCGCRIGQLVTIGWR